MVPSMGYLVIFIPRNKKMMNRNFSKVFLIKTCVDECTCPYSCDTNLRIWHIN